MKRCFPTLALAVLSISNLSISSALAVTPLEDVAAGSRQARYGRQITPRQLANSPNPNRGENTGRTASGTKPNVQFDKRVRFNDGTRGRLGGNRGTAPQTGRGPGNLTPRQIAEIRNRQATKIAENRVKLRQAKPDPSKYSHQTTTRRAVAQSGTKGGRTRATGGQVARTKTARSGKGPRIVKGVGGVATVGLIAGGAASMQQLAADRKSGRVTQAQYNRALATNGVELAGSAAALKKLTPTGMVLGSTIGTDPFSLGADAIGDVINGTDNAKQAVKAIPGNLVKSVNGHVEGVKTLVTDPGKWAKGAAKDAKNTVEGIGNGVVGVAKGIGGIFGKRKS